MTLYRRPFASVPEMDAAMVARWNEVVGPEDEVWHLGDFAIKQRPERVTELLTRLNGRKHLVVGNNDPPGVVDHPEWASVQHYAELQLDGVHLVLCHYAFRTWNRMGRGTMNLHGHSHGKLKPMARQIDVGVDRWGFRPIGLAEIGTRVGARNRKTSPCVPSGDPA